MEDCCAEHFLADTVLQFSCFLVCPSVRPPLFQNSFRRKSYTSLCLATYVNSSGESEGIYRPTKKHSPFSIPSVFLCVSSWWNIPGPLHKGGSHIQMPEPPRLAPLAVEKQWLYSETRLDEIQFFSCYIPQA